MLKILKSLLPSWIQRVWTIIREWIGIPLLTSLVSLLIIARITGFLVGPDSYTVYIVGDSSDQNVQKLWQAFEEQTRRDLKIGGQLINFVFLDAKEKDAEKLSAKLSKKDDTLAIIGHFSSTASAAALPNYINADPPMPVILPIETNPELLPPDYHISYVPVFRLSPTDDKQAEKAATFALKREARAIWVIEDALTNQLYSRYLAQQFIKQIHDKSSRHGDGGLQRSDLNPIGRITEREIQKHQKFNDHSKASLNRGFVAIASSESIRNEQASPYGRVMLYTTNINMPSRETLKALNIDFVFFAGSPTDCLILSRRVKELWADSQEMNRPSLLLGNACASEQLIEQGGSDLGEAFLTHAMLASEFQKDGFAHRGRQAYKLLQQLVEQSNHDFNELAKRNGSLMFYVRWLAGIHSVVDARNALVSCMERAVDTERTFMLDDDWYTFERNGTVKEAAYHVWKVKTLSDKAQFADFNQ
jgi:hypothetical protein